MSLSTPRVYNTHPRHASTLHDNTFSLFAGGFRRVGRTCRDGHPQREVRGPGGELVSWESFLVGEELAWRVILDVTEHQVSILFSKTGSTFLKKKVSPGSLV